MDTKIDWGDEAERILHHSQHPVADMIVMGSRGLSPLQGLFLGSVSHKVFHLAECTCATVHAGRDHPGLERLDRVLIAHDGSDHAKKALELGADLAARFDAEVVLLHVTLRNASAEQLLRSCDPDHLDGATRQNLERAVEDSAVAVGGVPAWIPLVDSDIESVGKCILAEAEDTARANGVAKVTSKVVDGDPARRILDAAEHESADLIVMGMRGLGEVAGMLVGSVSYKVSHLARATCIAVR